MAVRIGSFKFGSITIDKKKYDHDVIVTWHGKVKPADFSERHLFGKEEMMELLFERPEVIVIGIGTESLVRVDPDVLEFAEQKNVQIIDRPTELAIDDFNELVREGRHVVAYMHITC
jgi:hypothetical protein